jgi:DNA-binding transcriptional MerR regulator
LDLDMRRRISRFQTLDHDICHLNLENVSSTPTIDRAIFGPEMSNYTLEAMARLARVQPTTVRSYVQKGLLPKAELHGRRTYYDDGYLARLQAVRYLLHTERLSVRQIRAKLSRLSDAEVAALLPRVPVPPAPAPLPGPDDAFVGESWERAVLLPGLELHLAATASDAVRAIAADVAAEFRSRLAPP